jgi:hypothetical protein
MSARLPPGPVFRDGCCHPPPAMHTCAALTLRMVTGLRMTEIARAFLVPGGHQGEAHHPRESEDQSCSHCRRARYEPLLVSGSGRSGRRCTARVRLDGEPEAEVDEAPASARSQRRPRVSYGGRAGGQSAGRRSAASPGPGWRSRGPRPVPAACCHSLDFGHALTS